MLDATGTGVAGTVVPGTVVPGTVAAGTVAAGTVAAGTVLAGTVVVDAAFEVGVSTGGADAEMASDAVVGAPVERSVRLLSWRVTTTTSVTAATVDTPTPAHIPERDPKRASRDAACPNGPTPTPPDGALIAG